jgi:23S rRNA (cytidine1920-2'-O)/16S rRNA (cytidine1409-2'-O)-methyltransferase
MASRPKIRLDQHLVDRSLAVDTDEATALVMAGKVSVVGVRQSPTPGMQVRADAVVKVTPRKQFVSRGGQKLAKALEVFNVQIKDKIALDVGASTGGFTDCLLQGGASRVYAIDTGRGQLHHKLLADDRVLSMERTNIFDGIVLPELADVMVADVSFTSLEKILPAAIGYLVPGGHVIVLLKPQFEARRTDVPTGGVITDPLTQAKVIGRFVKWAGDSNIRIRNLLSSPLLGDKGNREFLLHLEPGG